MDFTSPLSEYGGILLGGAVLAVSSLTAVVITPSKNKKQKTESNSDFIPDHSNKCNFLEYLDEYNDMYDSCIDGIGRGLALAPRTKNHYHTLKIALKDLGIEVEDTSNDYAVLDLRFLMEESSFESERNLLHELWEYGGLLLGPGEKYGYDNPGYFRLYCTHLSTEQMVSIVDRFNRVLVHHRFKNRGNKVSGLDYGESSQRKEKKRVRGDDD